MIKSSSTQIFFQIVGDFHGDSWFSEVSSTDSDCGGTCEEKFDCIGEISDTAHADNRNFNDLSGLIDHTERDGLNCAARKSARNIS